MLPALLRRLTFASGGRQACAGWASMPVAIDAAGAAVFGARLSSARGILQALKKRYTIPRMCLTSRNSSWCRTKRERGVGKRDGEMVLCKQCAVSEGRGLLAVAPQKALACIEGIPLSSRGAFNRVVDVMPLSYATILSLVIHLWASGRIPGWICVVLFGVLMVKDRRCESRSSRCLQWADYRTAPGALANGSPRDAWFVAPGVWP